MLAWKGGRRKLVEMKKARRRLEGVFNTVSTKTVRPTTKGRGPASASQVASLSNDFSTLNTNTRPVTRRQARANKMNLNQGADALAAPSRATGSDTTSLDILAIRGGHLRTVFRTQEPVEHFQRGNNVQEGAPATSGASTHDWADTPRVLGNPSTKPSGSNAAKISDSGNNLDSMEL